MYGSSHATNIVFNVCYYYVEQWLTLLVMQQVIPVYHNSGSSLKYQVMYDRLTSQWTSVYGCGWVCRNHFVAFCKVVRFN